MKQPWMKWYPSDWRGDARLRMCKPMTRYVWMEMLGLMHEAESYGHLTMDGTPMEVEALAALIQVPVADVKAAIKELRKRGVSSETDEGIIVSRRMIRDEDRSKRAQKDGRKGGNPKLKNQEVSMLEDKGQSGPPLKPHIPEARVQSPERERLATATAIAGHPAPGLAAAAPPAGPKLSHETVKRPIGSVQEEHDIVQHACRQALGDHAPLDPIVGPMVQLVRSGFTLDMIADALAAEARRPRRKPIQTWALWAHIITPTLENYRPKPVVTKPAPPAPPTWIGGKAYRDDRLREIVAEWRATGTWDRAMGPPPYSEACDVPMRLYATDEERAKANAWAKARGTDDEYPWPWPKPALRLVGES